MKKNVSGKKVVHTLIKSWIYTAFGFISLIALLLIVSMLFRRFGAYKLLIGTFSFIFVINALLFLFSEVIIVKTFKAKRIEKDEKYKDLVSDIRDLCKGKLLLRVPRLYLLEMGSANACAFGWGFLGQYGIGFTPELLEKLDRNEVRAVAAHELAHIMHFDVGINSTLSLSSNFAALLAFRVIRAGGLFAGPIGWILSGVLWIIGRIIKLLLYLVSQERELAADALGSWYVKSPDYLLSGLKKLSSGKKKYAKKESFIKDIMISHPEMDERFESLENLKN